jgi:hypothetical protein
MQCRHYDHSLKVVLYIWNRLLFEMQPSVSEQFIHSALLFWINWIGVLFLIEGHAELGKVGYSNVHIVTLILCVCVCACASGWTLCTTSLSTSRAVTSRTPSNAAPSTGDPLSVPSLRSVTIIVLHLSALTSRGTVHSTSQKFGHTYSFNGFSLFFTIFYIVE